MESDPSEDPRDAEHTQAAADNSRPDDAGDDAEPIVLPVVVVPAAESPEGELSSESGSPADAAAAGVEPPQVESDPRVESPLGADSLTADVRQLIDHLRPTQDFEVHLPRPEDDAAIEDEMTLEEAIDHFVGPAEARMRELGLGKPSSVSRAFLRHDEPRPGVEHAILRSGDASGGATQLSALHGEDESSADDRDSVSGPAIHTGDMPRGERGEPAPRLELIVRMADSRAVIDEAIDAAIQRGAPQFREIADAAVDLGFWRYGNSQRAADWRLRGP